MIPLTERVLDMFLAKARLIRFNLRKHLRMLIIGGSRGALPARAPPPPQQDPFLSFSHMFLLKSVRIGGRRPPQREILDPPLLVMRNHKISQF